MAITIPSTLDFFGEKKDFQGCAGINTSNLFNLSCQGWLRCTGKS
jgi:hypothetical protein